MTGERDGPRGAASCGRSHDTGGMDVMGARIGTMTDTVIAAGASFLAR